jgi:hypothetical protein
VPRTEAITRLQQADISFGSVADFEGTHSRSSALCQKRLAVCMPESGRERSRLSFRRLADQPEAAVGVGRRERGKRTHDGKAYIRKALPHRDFASTSLSVAFWMKSSICDTRARSWVWGVYGTARASALDQLLTSERCIDLVRFVPIADMGAQQVLTPGLQWDLGYADASSSRDAGDLRALKTQTVHQSLLIKNEADDGAGKAVGIDGSSGANRDDHD